ncbi:hypothetical protein ACLOJK_040476 [Asimina triloba]
MVGEPIFYLNELLSAFDFTKETAPQSSKDEEDGIRPERPNFSPWGGSNGDNEDGESRSLIPEVVPNCSLEELAALDDLRAEKGSNSIKGEDEYGNWKAGNNGVQTDERRRMRGRGRRRRRKNKRGWRFPRRENGFFSPGIHISAGEELRAFALGFGELFPSSREDDGGLAVREDADRICRGRWRRRSLGRGSRRRRWTQMQGEIVADEEEGGGGGRLGLAD